MNVFLVSPGRTATTTLSEALKKIEGYTSLHESRIQFLGKDRVSYPENHFECDNRLIWFLPRLTKEYGKRSMLVNVLRDRESIAKSYNRRWDGIKIMKAYSQGILMRPLNNNNFDVCMDYVNNVYEHIEYFSKDWAYYVEVDLANPDIGMEEIFKILDVSGEGVCDYLKGNSLNQNRTDLKVKLKGLKFNFKCMVYDLFKS